MPDSKTQSSNIPHDNMLQMFGKTSKVMIYMPIIIIVLILLAKLSSPPRPAKSQIRLTGIPSQSQSASPANLFLFDTNVTGSTSKISTQSAGFDLKGPSICTISNDGTDIKAYIKNAQIYAEFLNKSESKRLLVNGDCLYNWSVREATGTKMCGISQYMSMAQMLSQSGLISVETILQYLAKIQPSVKVPNARDISQSCIKTEVKDSYFVIPTTIQFKEEALKTNK